MIFLVKHQTHIQAGSKHHKVPSTDILERKMSCSDEYTEFGRVTARKMFGGAGLYYNGLMFALIADDIVYLKVDDSNRADYEELGFEPFKPYAHSTMVMQYYEVPVDVLENKYELRLWADKAYQTAVRKKKTKSTASKKSSQQTRPDVKDITPEKILHPHTVKIRTIAEQLCALIKQTVPEATEKAYPGWHGIGYASSAEGVFLRCFSAHRRCQTLF